MKIIQPVWRALLPNFGPPTLFEQYALERGKTYTVQISKDGGATWQDDHPITIGGSGPTPAYLTVQAAQGTLSEFTRIVLS